jgi:hypothetical protein
VIGNAASEPHVQDLARMLVKMGADIQGIGSNLITVNGIERLSGCAHDIAPDHIEIGSFMALAGVTGGELRIKDTVPEDLRMIRLVFERVHGSAFMVVTHPAFKCHTRPRPRRDQRALQRSRVKGIGGKAKHGRESEEWILNFNAKPPRRRVRSSPSGGRKPKRHESEFWVFWLSTKYLSFGFRLCLFAALR